VITGVSRGLGEALFAEAYRRGDRVVGVGRRFTAAQRDLAAAHPDRVVLLTADLAEPEAVPDATALGPALGECREAVLVHNAGTVGPVGYVGELPADELTRTVTVNLTAPMLLTNAFLAAAPAGATRVDVVFVTSGAARRVVEGWAPYSATKAGGEMFVAVVTAEAARRDPRVRAVSVNPGVMDTDMQATLRRSRFPEHDRFVERYARGELADPAEVARRVLDQDLTSE
jgi:NAD(P)-dependent dehydrogenase (short-subunit alcohol dehydrogenase family)